MAALTRLEPTPAMVGCISSASRASSASASFRKIGAEAVYCIMTYRGEIGPALAFLSPRKFLQFEVEKPWDRMQWFDKQSRHFIAQIEPANGS